MIQNLSLERSYLECGVETDKVGEIVVPVINNFFENVSFSGNVLSLLFLDNLTLLTNLNGKLITIQAKS